MPQEPRDLGVAAMFRATVRVARGSGVVIRNGSAALIATAAHVVRGADLHQVSRGLVHGEGPVIVRDEDLDLALVTPPPALEELAIAVADGSMDVAPGDSVWATGFPRGWKGPDPVLAPGTIAGLGEESWVNLDGTWGNSGGPLCRVFDGRPLVVGILLGNASDASEALDGWARMFGEDAGQFRAAIEDLRERHGALTKEAIAEMTRPLKVDAQAGKLDASLPAVQIRMLAMMQAIAGKALATLIDEHFRTGFLRFAPVADLRKLLGPGDGRPSI